MAGALGAAALGAALTAVGYVAFNDVVFFAGVLLLAGGGFATLLLAAEDRPAHRRPRGRR